MHFLLLAVHGKQELLVAGREIQLLDHVFQKEWLAVYFYFGNEAFDFEEVHDAGIDDEKTMGIPNKSSVVNTIKLADSGDDPLGESMQHGEKPGVSFDLSLHSHENCAVLTRFRDSLESIIAD